MAQPNPKPKIMAFPFMEDDDDFQNCPPLSSRLPLPNKKLKTQTLESEETHSVAYFEELSCGLDSIEPSLELLNQYEVATDDINTRISNSVERNLMGEESACDEEGGGSTQIDMLLKLCDEVIALRCPVCGADLSDLNDDARQVHTNECLDRFQGSDEVSDRDGDKGAHECPGQVVDGSPLKNHKKDVDMSPVIEWLRLLGLSKYEAIFVSHEIDFEALQWLTEEDLCSIGITALGPRKKILHALCDLRNNTTRVDKTTNVSKRSADENRQGTYKKITDFFSGPPSERRAVLTNVQNNVSRSQTTSTCKNTVKKSRGGNGKQKDVPSWCCIPGTPFRVDAFKYLRRDCSHWFLTHFHLDHYQGLTRSFCHGKIYCSTITAKLVNLKIGIPFDDIQVLPLNQKINIAGTDVTCFDANHCPGAIIILFEPPNGKPVLHTGDFRFSEGMAQLSLLQSCAIDTLILDTTYCDPKYDFPKQESVIQFVIDAIQAEAFNPKTLFLIGSYTIGKERLFMDVGRALRKKVYVTTAKLRLLECIGLQPEDMQWLTTNEEESHIHVVPMWSIASFKRLKHMSNQYTGRFSLIVAFSPTGLTFGKGKKSTGGRRWQQGTIIRYEVPYSEHCSFTELKEFVKFVSPLNIIPSVNNQDKDSHNSMVSLLLLDNSIENH